MAIDKVFGPVDVAISGMQAQNKNLSAIYSNVANARTTDAGGGVPYRRVEAIFRSQDEGDPLGGVMVDKIAQDRSAFPEIFDPTSPNADAGGYVKMPCQPAHGDDQPDHCHAGLPGQCGGAETLSADRGHGP
jgi:flagellar basal-body rod protein FlgC